MVEKLENYVETYINNEQNNNQIHADFTEKTNLIPYLKSHRDFIEEQNLGFGDRAFTYMWFLILNYVKDNNLKGGLLEIGVFKGQVISLWSLISREINLNNEIIAITPLKGTIPLPSIFRRVLRRISKRYNDMVKSLNHYEYIDYLSIIKSLFKNFDLPFNKLEIYKGYSTDNSILEKVNKKPFSVIYMDGDHTYDVVKKDIDNYSKLLHQGGLLIMDDAACNIPGTSFWKGHQSVSDAALVIESLGFKNLLNVGHNRIYQKL